MDKAERNANNAFEIMFMPATKDETDGAGAVMPQTRSLEEPEESETIETLETLKAIDELERLKVKEGGEEGERPTAPLTANAPAARSKKETPPLIRAASTILAVVFCAVSAAIYITGAANAAAERLGGGVSEILTREVFGGDAKIETESAESPTMPSPDAESDTEAADSPSEDLQTETPEKFPSQRCDLSVSAENALTPNNETAYIPDIQSLSAIGNKSPTCGEIYEKYGSDAPVVLIVHTHGTESYSESEDGYTEDESFRSENTNENVVAVGETMAEVLRKAGINVIHDVNMYDRESYRESYSRSYAGVQSALEKYPSISYVFDVHRDAIIKEDRTKICPVKTVDGQDVAQVMLVVGTDEGGAEHPSWQDNLSFALSVQSNLAKNADGVARAINLRSAAFNQALSKGSLLIEVGSCGNTLPQAKRGAILTSLAIARAIGGKEIPETPAELFSELS